MATYDPASYGRQFDSAWANWSPVDYQGGLPPELLRAIQQHASNSIGHLDSDGNWVSSPNPNGHIVSPDGRWQLSVLPTPQGPQYQLNDLLQGGPGEPYYTFDQSGKFQTVETGAKAMSGGQGLAMVGLSALGMGALGSMIGGAGAAGAGAGAGAAGAGAGALDLGGGLSMLADGSIVGASSSLGAFPTNAGIMSSIGAGGSSVMGASGMGWLDAIKGGASSLLSGAGGSGGGGSSPLGSIGNILSNGGGISDWLGIGSTLLGAYGGAKGNEASQTTSRAMDPRMDGLFYGDLAPRTQGLLASQLPVAAGAGGQMMQVGSGLLGRTAPDTPTNPYLQGRADDIQRRTQDLLGQNNLAIQGNAVATGGLGGSRQGVAQGIAAGKAADYLQGNLAGMYGQAYDQDQNRLRQDWTIGSGLMNQGLNTQFAPLQNAANVYQPFTGFGSTTSSAQSGGGLMGAAGGALGAAQLGKNLGWW